MLDHKINQTQKKFSSLEDCVRWVHLYLPLFVESKSGLTYPYKDSKCHKECAEVLGSALWVYLNNDQNGKQII